MREGAVSHWLVPDGAEVTRGQEILEVETDKATMSYEAEYDGVLRILVAEGINVEVGQVIATIGGPSIAPPKPATADAPPSAVTPATTVAPRAPGRPDASPLLRRLAAERGVDPRTVRGSGPDGKIVRADILAAETAAPNAPSPSASAGTRSGATGSTGIPLTRSQALIARRMTEAKRTIPDFWVTASIDVTILLALRAELRASYSNDGESGALTGGGRADPQRLCGRGVRPGLYRPSSAESSLRRRRRANRTADQHRSRRRGRGWATGSRRRWRGLPVGVPDRGAVP